MLPNRNLDWGYAKLDLGGSYKLLSWLKVYAQAENLTATGTSPRSAIPACPSTPRRPAHRVDQGCQALKNRGASGGALRSADLAELRPGCAHLPALIGLTQLHWTARVAVPIQESLARQADCGGGGQILQGA